VSRAGAVHPPFQTFRQLARHLREGVLVLARPPTCVFCGRDCGFIKDGHYFRDFVFLAVVVTHVAVQRYLCKKAGSTFSALAAFQEPRAHYAVHVRGAVLDSVFVEGRSPGRAWRLLSRKPGGAFLSRSTVWAWCARFRDRVAGHAAALRRTIGGDFPPRAARFLEAAHAAFGSSADRPRPTFWEWLEDRLRREKRHLLSA
jgi:hypothetical protein